MTFCSCSKISRHTFFLRGISGTFFMVEGVGGGGLGGEVEERGEEIVLKRALQ